MLRVSFRPQPEPTPCSGTSLGRLCNVGFISRHHRRRRLEEADPSGSVFDTGRAGGVRFAAEDRNRESGRAAVFRCCIRQNGNHRERPPRSCHSGNRDSCGFARSTGVVFKSGLSATMAGRLTTSEPDGRNTASASFFLDSPGCLLSRHARCFKVVDNIRPNETRAVVHWSPNG